MRSAPLLAAAVALIAAAAMLILAGPSQTIVCSQATAPNSWLGDTRGQVDGADFTGCVVPTDTAWMIASVLLGIAVVLLLRTFQPSRAT